LSYTISEIRVQCGGDERVAWLLDPEHTDPRTIAQKQFGADRVVSVRIVRSDSDTMDSPQTAETKP
jgi:autonomous glycyl radical cofactor GrcA